MKKIIYYELIVLFAAASTNISLAQTPIALTDTVYNMANTSAFSAAGTESFRGVDVDASGRVWQ